MKRIYKEFSYGKELVGYEYKGYFIEIEEENIGMYGNFKRFYTATLKSGNQTGSYTLKDVKQKIDEELNNK